MELEANRIEKEQPHTPVMLEEVLGFYKEMKIRVFFDGTLGAGGHAEAILQDHPEIEMYIGCDRDPKALSIAAERLKPWKDKVRFVHGNHRNLSEILESLGVDGVDGFFLI